MTRLTCELLKRTSPIHVVIRGAVDTEPFAHELRTTMSEIRLATQRKMLHMYLHGALQNGLTEADAAERHFACSAARNSTMSSPLNSDGRTVATPAG